MRSDAGHVPRQFLGIETATSLIIMTVQDITSHEVVTFDDLKPFATASGPCITIAVPLPNPAEIEVRLKNAIRAVQRKLEESEIGATRSAGLIAPILELANTAETAGVWGHGVILFRSPDLFRHYLLHGPFNEVHTVEDRFQVRPLLAALTHEMRFYLLGLSRRQVRLFRCTQFRSEQLAIQGTVPQNMDTWLNSRQPDHALDNRASAGPSAGRMKGVTFGTSTDRDRDDEYLTHFLHAVEKAVTALLRHDPAPLVLAGVEYELSIYRRLNSYNRTIERSVNGSPDGMTERSLYDRAREIVMQTPAEPLQKALWDIRGHAGTSRVITDERSAIQAAWGGRVLDFLIAENAESWGAWNHETLDVSTGGRQEELLNAAAIQTLGHNGRAFVLKAADMPVDAGVAAFLRY
jgi:hypothetical protein